MTGGPSNGDIYPGHQSGQLDPTLAGFVDMFHTDNSRMWAANAVQRIQQHLTMRAVAQQNNKIGEDFVNNIAAFKGNLTKMVSDDPSSAGLALDLIKPTMQALAAEHPNLSDEDKASTAQSLTDHITNAVSYATVQSLAEKDEGHARSALQSPRLSSALTDDQKSGLSDYIDNQATWRSQDAVASQQQALYAQAQNGYNRATAYLGKLTDPQTNSLQLPDNFGQNVMSDTAITNPTSAALHDAFSRLQQTGDPDKSNPTVVADFFKSVSDGNPPSQAELLSHVGSNLNLADAQYLNGMLAPRNEAQRQDSDAIHNTIDAMRNTLLTPDNGPSGQAAFGRFTDWLMPALRTGAASGTAVQDMLDPEHADTIVDKLGQFQPTAQDAVPQTPDVRPSLGAIFGQTAPAPAPEADNTGET